MKIVRKISTCIFLLGFLCGVCAIPIVILGLPELTNIYRSRVDTNLGDWVAILGLGGVLLGFFITVLILIRVIRQVVLPVRIAAEFADKLANGEFPDRLSEERKANDEIQTLYTALNLLRDRQQNLNSKLKLSLSREADMRRGAESYSLLQLKIIARMLPEMRIPLGSIKGFSRILMLELESGKPDRAEIGRLLEETGHRVGALSRQIDRLVDIAELDRDRWERAEVVEFDTAEFMRELVAFNQISLQEREVMLVNHFSASAPERLVLDRELLHQLLLAIRRAYTEEMRCRTVMTPSERDYYPAFRKICDSLRKEYRREFRIGSLAAEVNLSPERFSVLYRKFFGRSPYAELIDARILAAKRLLTSTAFTVKEISAMCGWQDQYYFSRLFKEKCAVSPRDFRRHYNRYAK